MKKTYSKDVLDFGLKLKKAAKIVFFVWLGLGVVGVLITLLIALSDHLAFYRFMIPFFISISQLLFAALAYFVLILLSYHFIGIGQTAVNTDRLSGGEITTATTADDSDDLPEL